MFNLQVTCFVSAVQIIVLLQNSGKYYTGIFKFKTNDLHFLYCWPFNVIIDKHVYSMEIVITYFIYCLVKL